MHKKKFLIVFMMITGALQAADDSRTPSTIRSCVSTPRGTSESCEPATRAITPECTAAEEALHRHRASRNGTERPITIASLMEERRNFTEPARPAAAQAEDSRQEILRRYRELRNGAGRPTTIASLVAAARADEETRSQENPSSSVNSQPTTCNASIDTIEHYAGPMTQPVHPDVEFFQMFDAMEHVTPTTPERRRRQIAHLLRTEREQREAARREIDLNSRISVRELTAIQRQRRSEQLSETEPYFSFVRNPGTTTQEESQDTLPQAAASTTDTSSSRRLEEPSLDRFNVSSSSSDASDNDEA